VSLGPDWLLDQGGDRVVAQPDEACADLGQRQVFVL